MTEHVKVAVVGGGIVGCAVLYGLAKRGWTDTLLLERLELTSGSTWHAAGNITHFGHYTEITRLYVDSLDIYLEAEQESGQSVGFHQTGSLRLATTEHELRAYESIIPVYEDMGVPYDLISPEEIAALHPLLETDGLYGAAHTPGDGHVDASGATHAMAKSARARGAGIRRHCPVQTVSQRDGGGWSIETENGSVRAEHVVLAASFWTRELAAQIGLDLPLYALEHHEVITDDLPELAALDFELPTVRDPYAPSNTRQEQNGMLCGVYEKNPVFWGTDGIPPEFGQELFAPNMERLEAHLLRVMERIPAFGEAGIKAVNNGPICYAPDGCPMVGPVTGQEGLWLAAGFPVGIGTGGGSGDFLAEWITEGRPPYELPIIYASRFEDPPSQEEALRLIRETYAKGYVLPSV